MAENEGATEFEGPNETDPATGGNPAEDLDPFEGVGTEGENEPSPLEQGGQRFNQVWARMKKAEAATEENKLENARLQERLRGLETQVRQPAQRQPTSQNIGLLTENDLQVAIDSGDSKELARVTAGIARQAGEQSARRSSKKQDETARYNTIINRATTEVNKYLEIAPSIATKDHPRWKEVEAAFTEDTVGLGSPSDARAELRALRAVFGPVDRFRARVDATKRAPVDNHQETGAGGTSTPQVPITPTVNNPFEDRPKIIDLSAIPKRYTDHWTFRGMSKEDQLKEANYLKPSQLARK